jgi:hypothetical protein
LQTKTVRVCVPVLSMIPTSKRERITCGKQRRLAATSRFGTGVGRGNGSSLVRLQLARDITGNRVKVHRDQRTKGWRAFGPAAFDRVRQRVGVGARLSRNQVRLFSAKAANDKDAHS